MTWDEVVPYLEIPGKKARLPSFISNDYIIGSYSEGLILKSSNGDILDYRPSLSEQLSTDWIVF